VPVPAARQRAALDLILTEALSSNSFRFDPKFMSRLAVDQFDRIQPGRYMFNTDFSLAAAVLGIQRNVLDGLMGDPMAARLADAESKVEDAKTLMSYADVQQQLSTAVWSELKAPAKGGAREIDSLRRNLQREHVRRLATALVRPGSAAAADVRPVLRQAVLQLQQRLTGTLAVAGKASSPIVKAHLEDSLATLAEALKAPLLKQGA
jgi:Met-zincin